MNSVKICNAKAFPEYEDLRVHLIHDLTTLVLGYLEALSKFDWQLEIFRRKLSDAEREGLDHFHFLENAEKVAFISASQIVMRIFDEIFCLWNKEQPKSLVTIPIMRGLDVIGFWSTNSLFAIRRLRAKNELYLCSVKEKPVKIHDFHSDKKFWVLGNGELLVKFPAPSSFERRRFDGNALHVVGDPIYIDKIHGKEICNALWLDEVFAVVTKNEKNEMFFCIGNLLKQEVTHFESLGTFESYQELGIEFVDDSFACYLKADKTIVSCWIQR